jgi:hypothetical protein
MSKTASRTEKAKTFQHANQHIEVSTQVRCKYATKASGFAVARL